MPSTVQCNILSKWGIWLKFHAWTHFFRYMAAIPLFNSPKRYENLIYKIDVLRN